MIVKNVEAMKQEVRNLHDGRGTVVGGTLLREEFDTNWQFVDWWTIPKNASIGTHKHEGEEELYFIVSGKGMMTVDTEEREVRAGDLVVTKSGSYHGLRNECGEVIKLLVALVKMWL